MLQKTGMSWLTTKGKYKQGDTIKFEAETIKSNLCDYSNAFILVTEDTTVNANNDTDVAFKNSEPFSTCTTKLNDIDFNLLMRQIIFKLQCLCKIWLNIAIIIQTRQEIYGILKEMTFRLTMLIWLLIIILNHLNTKRLF